MYNILGKIVTVTVDRTMGTFHSKYSDIFYTVNYGFIKNMMAPDGEDQDAYVLGVDYPVNEFTGSVVAIIHRLNDIEDKLVVAPQNLLLTKNEIMKQVYF